MSIFLGNVRSENLFTELSAKGCFLLHVWISGVHCLSALSLRRITEDGKDYPSFHYAILMPMKLVMLI